MIRKSWFSGITTTLILLLSISLPVLSADNTSDEEHGLGYIEKKRAERLFYGLIEVNGSAVNCAGCHNTTYIDTLNWNPSAYEIALSSNEKDSAAFASVLLNPLGKKLEEAHAGINLPAKDVQLLQTYLKEFKQKGVPQKKPSINKILIFFSLLILIVLAIIDLTLTKRVKFRAVHLLVLTAATFFLIEMLAKEAIALGRSQNYAPLQPVKFSHVVHAGTNQTDCQYCHHTADYSKSAGIPSVNVCMNCHIIVREGTNSGKFEINKIIAAHENGDPLEWVRIHRLPDHVFFSHAQHVGAGKLDCAECHGAVETMDVLRQENDLSMGWCIDCHRTRKVQFLENDYYETFEAYHEDIKNGSIDSVTVEQIGGTECMKCHY